MGVTALFKNVGGGAQRRNIEEDLRGKKVGVDGHFWLHEMARKHASAWKRGDWAPIVKEVIGRAAHLLSRGITPVFVFDGAPAPAEKGTDAERQKRRGEAYTSTRSMAWTTAPRTSP